MRHALQHFLFAISLFCWGLTAHGQVQHPQTVMNAFSTLISQTRGAIRQGVQTGEGCMPWFTLAKDLSDSTTYQGFGFNQELMRGIDPSPAGLGKLASRAARAGGYSYSVLGACEIDKSRGNGQEQNVIVLVLEGKNHPPLKLRYPFERDLQGQVVYIKEQATAGPSEPLVFADTPRN